MKRANDAAVISPRNCPLGLAEPAPRPLRVGLVGATSPRAWRLAAFTADVGVSLRSAGDEVVVAALVDTPEAKLRRATAHSMQSSEASARALAASLSIDVDVVLIEHEVGVFGGEGSATLQSLTDNLAVPYVIALHTVGEPLRTSQSSALAAPLAGAALVFVSTDEAVELITREFRHCREDVCVMPHPAPAAMCHRDAAGLCGVPSFAAAEGVPFVSTPHLHAANFAAEGWGPTVPLRDYKALAGARPRRLTNDAVRFTTPTRDEAASVQRSWPEVGRLIHDILGHVVDDRWATRDIHRHVPRIAHWSTP